MKKVLLIALLATPLAHAAEVAASKAPRAPVFSQARSIRCTWDESGLKAGFVGFGMFGLNSDYTSPGVYQIAKKRYFSAALKTDDEIQTRLCNTLAKILQDIRNPAESATCDAYSFDGKLIGTKHCDAAGRVAVAPAPAPAAAPAPEHH